MTWFRTELTRDGARAVVSVDDATATVTVALPDAAPVSRRYASVWEEAACVFETNVAGLIADGFAVTHEEGAPGCLACFGDGGDDDDELSWVRWSGDVVAAAGIDGADPQATYDGTQRSLQVAPALGSFDPADPDPFGEPLHAMRRLAWHPAAAHTQLVLAVGLAHDRLLDRAVATGLAARTVDLSVIGGWRDGPRIGARRLEREFARVQCLALPRWSLARLVGGPWPSVRHLALMTTWTEVSRAPVPDTPWTQTFDRIAAIAPQLRSLRVPQASVEPAALDALLWHPLTARVHTLDLVALSHRADLDRLVAAQAELPNLRDVFVSGHALSDDDRARLAAWPAIAAVDHRFEEPRYRAHRAQVRPWWPRR